MLINVVIILSVENFDPVGLNYIFGQSKYNDSPRQF